MLATTPSQNQGYNSAHSDTYLVFEPVDYVKGLDLQIHSCKISMTQGNNMMSKKSPSEGPVFKMRQKRLASN